MSSENTGPLAASPQALVRVLLLDALSSPLSPALSLACKQSQRPMACGPTIIDKKRPRYTDLSINREAAFPQMKKGEKSRPVPSKTSLGESWQNATHSQASSELFPKAIPSPHDQCFTSAMEAERRAKARCPHSWPGP